MGLIVEIANTKTVLEEKKKKGKEKVTTSRQLLFANK